MTMAYIPEWQLQQALGENPRPLELPGVFEGIRVRKEQRYLPSIGRYIDLLCRTKVPGGWLIVEIKANPILDEGPVRQALDYRTALASELSIEKRAIGCMVAAPGQASPEAIAFSSREGVVIRDLDLNSIISRKPNARGPFLMAPYEAQRKAILARRLCSGEASKSQGSTVAGSVDHWLRVGEHDRVGLTGLAACVKEVSATAPVFAHEVGGKASSLDTSEKQWFWLFYSAIDRRGNAALFIRGKEALEQKGLFEPSSITNLVTACGVEQARRILADTLAQSGVPLVIDLHLGRESLAQSIIDAAGFYVKSGNSLTVAFERWKEVCERSGQDLGLYIVKELQDAVYGMGPRSAAQFVRGMVLKGPWRATLHDRVFLEDTKYNGLFAGPARLSIALEDFHKESLAFTDSYLGGNKGLLSHALWYIRKRYCDKIPLCEECPAAGYCAYYRNTVTKRRLGSPGSIRHRVTRGVQLQLPG